MATLNEILQQGFASPAFNAGIGIMLGSQRGGQGPVAGLMQGMQLYRQQQQAAQQQQQMQMAAAQLKLQQEAAQKKAEAESRFQQGALQDPSIFGDNRASQLAATAGLGAQVAGGLKGIGAPPAPLNPLQQAQADYYRYKANPQAQPLNPLQEAQMRLAQARQQKLMNPDQIPLTQVEQATVDLKKQQAASLANPKPKPGMTYDVHNADGSTTQMIWDAAQGRHVPGSTYISTAQQNAFTSQGELQRKEARDQEDQARKDAAASVAQGRLDLQKRQFDQAERQAWLKQNFDMTTATATYKGAMAGLADMGGAIQQLLQSPGFNSLFGPNSKFPAIPGTNAADSQAILDRIVAMSGLQGMADLKQRGVSLSPTTDVDLNIVKNAAASLSNAQSDKAARAELNRLFMTTRRLAKDGTEAYDQTMQLYRAAPVPAPQGYQPQPQAQQAPVQQAPAQAAPTKLPGPQETVITEADIRATMQASGLSREQVVQGLQAKGYRIGAQ